MTEVVDEPLALARQLGAAQAVNVAANRDALAAEEVAKGRFDIAFECSGNPRALAQAIACVATGKNTSKQTGNSSRDSMLPALLAA